MEEIYCSLIVSQCFEAATGGGRGWEADKDCSQHGRQGWRGGHHPYYHPFHLCQLRSDIFSHAGSHKCMPNYMLNYVQEIKFLAQLWLKPQSCGEFMYKYSPQRWLNSSMLATARDRWRLGSTSSCFQCEKQSGELLYSYNILINQRYFIHNFTQI